MPQASSALTMLAGPQALDTLRERGLRPDDVEIVPGASGGPKWLVLEALDRFLFGDFLQRPRARPLHLIGSSIGSWRMACLAQRDPVAAVGRLREAYIEQRYPRKPPAALVTATGKAMLEHVLGETGDEEILAHPWVRLHVITAECRGLAASDWPPLQLLAMTAAAAGNLVSRRALALQMRRAIFHTAGDRSPFWELSDLPTLHLPLTPGNLRPALLASGAIPLVLEGVPIPDAPGGLHRDGGVIDYHLDLAYGEGEGLVLYPHFYPHLIPGWFDKALRWRWARRENLRRAIVLAPSPAFVASLPLGRIPDRGDFKRMPDEERIRVWRRVVAESERLSDELQALLESDRIADVAKPL